MTGTQQTGTGTVEEAAGAFGSLLSPDEGETQEEQGGQAEHEPDAAALEGAEADADEEEDKPEKAEKKEEQPAKTYTVKVDGKDAQVPLDELIRGYQRTSDYTRKTQQLAEQRRAAQTELESVKAERAHYAGALNNFVQQLQQQQQAQQPDWDTLITQNPQEYLRQQRIFQVRAQAMEAAQREAANIADRQERENQQAQRDFVESERKLLADAIPSWKDTKIQQAEKRAMVEFAARHGYSPEEINGVIDHRNVVLLRKAMLFDQMEAKRAALKPNGQQPGPKAAAPGSSRQATDIASARKRLAQTGAVEDAASVMLSMLK